MKPISRPISKNNSKPIPETPHTTSIENSDTPDNKPKAKPKEPEVKPKKLWGDESDDDDFLKQPLSLK
jgi:hypothetical protein